MKITIRQFQAGDAAALAEVMHTAVRASCNNACSPQQLAAWSPCAMAPEAFLERISDGRMIWVAEAQPDQPAGFIELEANGHIDCFYCFPARCGIGAALYQALEAEAVAQTLPGLFVEASEAARHFFLRAGFYCEKRLNITRRNVAMHHYRMTKALPGKP